VSSSALRRMALHAVRVSPKTIWVFVQLERGDGGVGSGEATLIGREPALLAAAGRFAERALRGPTDRPEAFAAAIVPADLAEAAIVSAIDQALWDLHALGTGDRLADALGGARREAIPIYANINRRTVRRTPDGFAQSARDALAAGFWALKLAPFDEVDPARCAGGDGPAAMRAGLDRVAAVRAAAGPHCRLMVDCHWRFDEPTALRLNSAAAELGVYWIECPLPEVDANIPALVRLRRHANGLGIRLAGLEQGIRFEAFRPYCEAGAYDVMMPDVKYIGGLKEMLRAAGAFAGYGVEVSPHNPSGPISHAASLHVAAAMETFDMLEMQFDESPLFDRLAGGVPERVAGRSALPRGPGLGAGLDAQLLEAHADSAACVWEAA
jgi:galactonate dehydratase